MDACKLADTPAIFPFPLWKLILIYNYLDTNISPVYRALP